VRAVKAAAAAAELAAQTVRPGLLAAPLGAGELVDREVTERVGPPDQTGLAAPKATERRSAAKLAGLAEEALAGLRERRQRQ